MTDQRARAKALLDALPVVFTCSQYGSIQLCKEAEAECLDTILTALADERRRVWEEAAKMAEEKAERSIKGEHLNIPEYNFGYRGGLRGLADEIRLKLYAKAHAGQEG